MLKVPLIDLTRTNSPDSLGPSLETSLHGNRDVVQPIPMPSTENETCATETPLSSVSEEDLIDPVILSSNVNLSDAIPVGYFRLRIHMERPHVQS